MQNSNYFVRKMGIKQQNYEVLGDFWDGMCEFCAEKQQ